MKKECKKTVLMFLIVTSIFLILLVPLVSAFSVFKTSLIPSLIFLYSEIFTNQDKNQNTERKQSLEKVHTKNREELLK